MAICRLSLFRNWAKYRIFRKFIGQEPCGLDILRKGFLPPRKVRKGQPFHRISLNHIKSLQIALTRLY